MPESDNDYDIEVPDEPDEVTQRKNDEPPVGGIALVCGALINFVLYYGDEIYLSTHNAGVPPAFLFLFAAVGWATALLGIKKKGWERIFSIIGIVLLIPGTLVFLWFVFTKVLPFYVNVICGGSP